MKKFSLACALGLLAVTSCNDPALQPNEFRELTASEVHVAEVNNDFAFNLFRKVHNDKNAFISPLSVGIALAMAMNGASPETQQSIINTIDFAGMPAEEVNAAYKGLTEMLLQMDPKVKMGLANSVWVDDDFTIKKSFQEILSSNYAARVETQDFGDTQTKNIINQWVESKTNGKITNLIEAIAPDEIMFLINAIYFKGNWTTRFDKSKTHTAPFTLENNSTVDVTMMNAKGVDVNVFFGPEFTLVDVPYGNGMFSFTILMPSNKTLDELTSALSSEILSEAIEQAEEANVELELPKFKMKWKSNILEKLESMGMYRSGFPNLVEQSVPIEISRVLHQSYIDVTEEGTEAAAATTVGFVTTSLPIGPPKITIDKPFLFLIRNTHANAILFMGQLLNPAELE